MASEQPKDFIFGFDVPALPGTTPTDRYEPIVNTVALFAKTASEGQDQDPEVAPLVKNIYATGLTFAAEFDQDVRKSLDRQYSREGSAKLRAAAAAKALKSLEPLEREAGKLREHVETFDATLHKGGVIQRPSDLTEEAWERRLSEVRAQLSHLDPVQREDMYSDALTKKDAVLIAAFESASPLLFEEREATGEVKRRGFMPFVKPERVLEKQLERARERYPEEVALRDRSERIGAAYSSVVALIKREVEARLGGAR